MKYPNYKGIYSPELQAHMKYTTEGVTITYNLTNVPCECAQIGTKMNSCGLHIHAGQSCATDALVLGHWYDQTTMTDPWAYTPYVAEKCSEVCLHDCNGTTASGSITVAYGKDFEATITRVLVVHDYQGNRIGCAQMSAPPPAHLEQPFQYLPYVIAGAGGFVLLVIIALYCRHRRAQRLRGTLNEKLVKPQTAAAAAAAAGPGTKDPTRRTLSVQRM